MKVGSDPISNARSKSKRGRPTVRTKAALKVILEAVSDGVPLKAAARVAGVSPRVFMEWRNEEPEVEEAVQEAREKARQAALKDLKVSGTKDWRATEAWLKLAFRDDYNAKPETVQSVQISQTVQGTITEQRLREIQDRRRAAMEAHGR